MCDYIEGNKYIINDIEYKFINIGEFTLGRYSRKIITSYVIDITKTITDYKLRKNLKIEGIKLINNYINYCNKIYSADLSKLSKDEKKNIKSNIINYFYKIIDFKYFNDDIKECLKSLYFYFIYYIN